MIGLLVVAVLVLCGVILWQLSSIRDSLQRLQDGQQRLWQRVGPGEPAPPARKPEAVAAGDVQPAPPPPPPPPPARVQHTVSKEEAAAAVQQEEGKDGSSGATVAEPPPLPAPPPAPSLEPASGEPGTRRRRAEPIGDIFRRMWNWVLVNDEQRGEGVSVEFAVASTWLLRIGILALVMGVVYFLRWTIVHDLLTEWTRVGIGLGVGVVMVLAGVRMLGKTYQLIGQGLVGGGLLILYLSLFAAYQWYGLIGSRTAGFGMGIVVIGAGIIAVAADSLLTAVFGLAGGYLAPLLLRTPDPDLASLYTCIVLLSLGVAGVARYRQWRLLNYLSFIGAYGLFLHSLEFYRSEHFGMALGFLCTLFLVHGSVVFIDNVLRRHRATVLDILHLLANAAVFAATAYGLVEGRYGRPYPAVLAAALAVFYAFQAWAFLRYRLVDRLLLIALMALAAAFAVWTLPLLLESEPLTVAMALVGVLYLWVGLKVRSNLLKYAGAGLFDVVLLRLLFFDLPRQYRAGAAVAASWGAYAGEALPRLGVFAGVAACFFVGFALLRGRVGVRRATVVKQGSDLPLLVEHRVLAWTLYWVGVAQLFVFLQLEAGVLLKLAELWRAPGLTLLWCALALVFGLHDGRRRGGAGGCALRIAACTALLAVLFKVLAGDMAAWGLGGGLVYTAPYRPLPAASRLLNVVLGGGIFVWFWQRYRRRAGSEAFGVLTGYAALAIVFVYATLELNTAALWLTPDFQRGSITVLWALFAMAFLVFGIRRATPSLRYLGLALFGIVCIKVQVDVAETAPLVRVVAFLAVGLLLVGGSAVYIQARKRFLAGGDKG